MVVTPRERAQMVHKMVVQTGTHVVHANSTTEDHASHVATAKMLVKVAQSTVAKAMRMDKKVADPVASVSIANQKPAEATK